jgi:hypothetical protein
MFLNFVNKYLHRDLYRGALWCAFAPPPLPFYRSGVPETSDIKNLKLN